MKNFEIIDIEEIKKFHESTASCTWGGGQVDADNGRVILAYISPNRKGDSATVLCCSIENWRKAYPE